MRVVGAGFAVGLLGTGCARYEPRPLDPDANAAGLEQRSLGDPRLLHFVAAALPQPASAGPIAWDLRTLSLAALYYHPEIEIARAELGLAGARIITAAQHPNPRLDFAAMIDRAASPGAIPAGALPATIGPVVNFVVESFGKREYRTAEARRLADAARWALATAGWQVRGRVRDGLLQLWAARQRLVLTRGRLDRQDRLAQLLERRLQVGEASGLDVARQRLDRAQTGLALRGVEAAAEAAQGRLATAIGLAAAALKDVSLSFAAFEQPPAPDAQAAARALRRRALTGRTDIQAALAQYEAAQAGLQLAVANQYPNVTLGVGYTYDAGTERYGLSPSVELPVFNQNQGPIAEARAKRRQAAAAFTAMQARIISAIDAAIADEDAARRQSATAAALLAGAQGREARVAASFRAGQLDRPSLLAAEIETAAIRLSQLDALVVWLQAVGALEDALQDPLFEPAAPFSPPAGEPAS